MVVEMNEARGVVWCHPITQTRSHLPLQSSNPASGRRLSGPTALGNSKHVGTRCSMCMLAISTAAQCAASQGRVLSCPGWCFCPSMACTSANLRPEANTHMWHTLQAKAHASCELTLIGKCIKAIRRAHCARNERHNL